MIVELYALPQGFTSPDDKPCLELFNYGVQNPAYKIAGDTIATPTLDDIEVQVGNNGDYSIKDMQAYNFIKYDTTGYQITNVELKQSNGVFYIYGKVDLYFTFLVSYFNTTGNRNGTPVFFKQKHLNRFVYQAPVPNGPTFPYVSPDKQFYLLNKYKQLKGIGDKVLKTPIYCHSGDYFSHTPSPHENKLNGYLASTISGYSTLDGQIPTETTVGNKSSGLNFLTINGSGYSGCDLLVYPNFYTNAYSVANSTPTNANPECYPCILGKLTANENNLYPSTPTPQDYYSNQSSITNAVSYPFPYGLSGVGGIQFGMSAGNILVENAGVVQTANAYSTSMSMAYAGPPGFDLCVDGEISDDYYIGVYLLPLPINCYFNQGSASESAPGSTGTTVGNLNGIASFRSTLTKATWDASDENIILQNNNQSYINGYGACFDPCIYIAQNNLYTLGEGTTIPDVPDLSYMEPAIINYERFNVRMYGQDNTVMVNAFTNLYADNSLMKDLIPYLMSFTITIAPPNMMLTNTPVSVYNSIAGFSEVWGTNIAYNNVQVGNYNNFNDALYSCILKSRAPNVSNNGNNYMATSKNAYDTGLNVSQLMAQKSILQAGEGAGMGLMGDNIAGAILNPVGDIFNAIGQEIKYSYELTGKKEDMSRTSNMRTSATSTINALFDSSFLLVAETPPIYEQIMVINYYALHGYLLERGDPFSNGYNRTYCNYVSILFFTNTMMVNLSATGKGRIDKMLENGFRVGSNVSELQKHSNDGGLTYDLVLINQTKDTYPNVELYQNNDEINYLIGEGSYDTATLIKNQSNFYATQTNQKNPSVQTNKDSTQK